jgi:hypothetical protein
MNIFICCFLFFSMTGRAEEPAPKTKQARLGHEFTLKVGEQVIIKKGGLKISLSAVAEDSRCPKGVTCIWAGNGRIIIRISKGNGRTVPLEFNTGVEPKQHRFQGYDIKLVGLNPYPQKDLPIKRDAYVATLLVNK